MELTDATAVRAATLANYAGALRQLRSGDFAVNVPAASDAWLNLLGVEIGELATVLEHRFDELARLSQISLDMHAGLLLEEILERAYESFRGLIPYDRIGCALIDHAAHTLRARWAKSESSNVRIGVGYEQTLHGSSLMTIVRSGRPRILNDLPSYLADHPGSDSTRRVVEEGMRASLTCPLVARGRPIGFLFFSSQQTGAYANVHVELFQRVAEQLSVVVEKSLLYERLVELNRQLTEAHRQLEHKSSHDGLTELPNRGAILAQLQAAWARSARSHGKFGVLLFDIDHFKRFNDDHGHLVGDECLRQVGRKLATVVRAGEAVGRYGGEEFLAVLDVGDAAELSAAAERFRQAVETVRVATPAGELGVTISVGGALACGRADVPIERIVADADAALYAAKAAGRNRTLLQPLGPQRAGPTH